jgi:hypothetical protein
MASQDIRVSKDNEIPQSPDKNLRSTQELATEKKAIE